MTIEDLLPPSPEFIDLYNHKIEVGIEYAKNIDLAIVCLARNIGDRIKLSLPFLLNLPYFKSVNVVVFENDSSDNTKQLLNELDREYTNLHLFTSYYNRPHLPLSKSNERTNHLAEYRNFCKNVVVDKLNHCQYTSVLDLDFIDISIRGWLNTFGWFAESESLQAIAGNSFQFKNVFSNDYKSVWNYDSWAFRGNWWIDKQTEVSAYDPMLWFGFWITPVGSPLIKVNSAFGGLCTYKTNWLTLEAYEGYDCEHVCFHKNLYKYPKFNLSLNPSQTILFE